jgi:lysophospholipase L1-like esterase
MAVSLAGAEALVRVLDLPPHPLAPLHVGSYRLSDDPILRYEYQPSLAPDHAAWDPMHAGLATNALGFRDREFAPGKPAGAVRILALGDSATVGLGVPEPGNTWPKQLEARLRRAGLENVAVLNLGVGGYDPEQEAQLLRVRGLALEPDLVLMLVTMNDLDTGVDGGVYEALLRARAHLDAPRPDPVGRLLRHSRLAFFAEHRLRALVGEARPRRSRARATGGDPLSQGLARLSELQREHGFRVLVFLLPGLDGPYERYAHHALHRRMEAIAAATPGIEWIDLLDGMAGVDRNLRLLSFDGLHPNRAGQAAVAELVFRHLRARSLP